MNPGYLRRGMAVLLLAIAFVDLAVIDIIAPQICNDGFFTIAGAAPAQNDAEKFDQDSHSESSPASTEEDCFCCCSHVLPCFSVDYITPNTTPRVNIALIASLPTPPPQDTFHPPRVA